MADPRTLMDALPGVSLEVGEVTAALAEMWQVESGPSGNFRASQLNLVLHFGMKTTPVEAQQRFQTAIRFAQRYPSRIIVLCPRPGGDNLPILSAKLFTQCYIGPSMREKCCCEALMLSYPTAEFEHLRNQVSVWLEADLPVYHWFHRVPRVRVESQYLSFVHSFQRVLYDSAVEGDEYNRIHWPRPARVSDLAVARLLPLKQGLGPFLAAYKPEVLLDGAAEVRIRADEAFRAEARAFATWVDACLHKCAEAAGREGGWKIGQSTEDMPEDLLLEMSWHASGSETLCWELAPSGRIRVSAHLGGGAVEQELVLTWLTEEAALSEAVFF